jgi:hypothetical protein
VRESVTGITGELSQSEDRLHILKKNEEQQSEYIITICLIDKG